MNSLVPSVHFEYIFLVESNQRDTIEIKWDTIRMLFLSQRTYVLRLDKRTQSFKDG